MFHVSCHLAVWKFLNTFDTGLCWLCVLFLPSSAPTLVSLKISWSYKLPLTLFTSVWCCYDIGSTGLQGSLSLSLSLGLHVPAWYASYHVFSSSCLVRVVSDLFWKIDFLASRMHRKQLQSPLFMSLWADLLWCITDPNYWNSSTISSCLSPTDRKCSSSSLPPTTNTLVLGTLMVSPHWLVISNSLDMTCTTFSFVCAKMAMSSANWSSLNFAVSHLDALEPMSHPSPISFVQFTSAFFHTLPTPGLHNQVEEQVEQSRSHCTTLP